MKNKTLILSLTLSCAFFILPIFGFSQDNLSNYINQLGSSSTRVKRNEAVEKLLDSGNKAIPLLINTLDSDDFAQKYTAIKILYELKATEAVPKLIDLLNDKDKKIQIASAYALGKIHDKRATDSLINLLKTTVDEGCKKAAIIGLGFLGDKTAIHFLKNELDNKSQIIRIMAAGALGLLGNIDGFNEALTGTYSNDTNIQKEAMQSLGLIGDKRAIQRLNELIADPDIEWKNYARVALKQIEISNLPPDQKISALGDYLYDKNKKIVEWAIETLAEIGTPEAFSLLEQKARSGKDKASYKASRKLKVLNKGD